MQINWNYTREVIAIGRVLVVEFNDQESSVFDAVINVLKHHSSFEILQQGDEAAISLPGLEIFPERRKIYRDRREIDLTTKEFDILCLLLLKELSTGNLKEAYLITAFALKPRLLILDEPVNGLDYQSTEYLYWQINSYRKYGTILFSSHILESICLTSDRVLVLEQGQIKKSFTGQEIESGNIREVLKE